MPATGPINKSGKHENAPADTKRSSEIPLLPATLHKTDPLAPQGNLKRSLSANEHQALGIFPQLEAFKMLLTTDHTLPDSIKDMVALLEKTLVTVLKKIISADVKEFLENFRVALNGDNLTNMKSFAWAIVEMLSEEKKQKLSSAIANPKSA